MFISAHNYARKPITEESQNRTSRQELKQRVWRNAAHWLALHDLFSCFLLQPKTTCSVGWTLPYQSSIKKCSTEEQGSAHLPPGPVEIQGHRPDTREKQEHITDNKMARGKQKSMSQGNQDDLAIAELSSPITANIGMPNTPEKEDADLKSYLKTLIEILKQEREEKQKDSEAFKEETRKTLKELKELEENRTKKMKEWKKKFKMEIDTIKKNTKRNNPEVKHLKKKSGVTEASISNRL